MDKIMINKLTRLTDLSNVGRFESSAGILFARLTVIVIRNWMVRSDLPSAKLRNCPAWILDVNPNVVINGLLGIDSTQAKSIQIPMICVATTSLSPHSAMLQNTL